MERDINDLSLKKLNLLVFNEKLIEFRILEDSS